MAGHLPQCKGRTESNPAYATQYPQQAGSIWSNDLEYQDWNKRDMKIPGDFVLNCLEWSKRDGIDDSRDAPDSRHGDIVYCKLRGFQLKTSRTGWTVLSCVYVISCDGRPSNQNLSKNLYLAGLSMFWNFTKIRMSNVEINLIILNKHQGGNCIPFPSWVGNRSLTPCRHGRFNTNVGFATGLAFRDWAKRDWTDELKSLQLALRSKCGRPRCNFVGRVFWLALVSLKAFSSAITARFTMLRSPSWSWFGRRRVHCWRMVVNERRKQNWWEFDGNLIP